VPDPSPEPGAPQSGRTAIAWPAISPMVADQLRPVLPVLVEQMVAEILASVDEYAQPPRSGHDSYEHGVRRGAQEAASQFVSRIADPGAGRDQSADLFRRLGQAEAGEGRSLEALQAALRAGARAALRSLTAASGRMDAPLETLRQLTEALLVFLDEIAAEFAEGYANAHTAGDRQRRRRRLIGLLLADAPPAPRAIAELARLSQWRRPRQVSVILLAGCPSRPALPEEFLADLDRTPPVLIVPDPYGPGRRAVLDQCLRGQRGAVGPAVPLTDAAKSLRWAAEALSLAEQGAFAGFSVIHCDDHLSEMVLRRGGDLLARLEARRLAPLQQMTPGRKDMLADTLLAWLETGKCGSVASRLFIHPQTARYRLHRLQELFGDQLDNPDARFELALVLRARGQRQQCAARAPAAPG
jgi:hypothetical protein